MNSSEGYDSDATLIELLRSADFDRIKVLLFERKLIPQEKLKEIEASKNKEEQKEIFKAELLKLEPDSLKNFVYILYGTDQYEAILNKTKKIKGRPSRFIEATHLFTVKEAKYLMKGKDIYPMKSKIRGPCIIINNVDFISCEKRYGSDVDAGKLKHLFEQLHFQIYMKRNLTAVEMKNFLIEVKSQFDINKPDCVFVIILTHGGYETMVGIDEEALSQNYIISLFNNNNAPSFQGVPKIFIFEACHGDTFDHGALAHTTTVCQEEGGTDFKDTGHKRMATFTDMLIARSSMRGYVSLRNVISGSWYCDELVGVFTEHSRDTRLLDMLMMVSERVSERQSHDGEWQCPTTELLVWNKQLYFNPGFQE